MTEAAQGPSAAPVSGAPIVPQISPDNSEVRAGKPPHLDSVWMPGYWHWDGVRYVWQRGHWERI